jgi:integrase
VGTRLFTPSSAAPGQSRDVIGLRLEPIDRARRARGDSLTRCPYIGPRIGEALRLTWANVDQQAGLARVHREHAPLKTEAGRREVILAPTLAKSLRERWLANHSKAPRDFVFGNTLGRGLDYRDVGEAFRQAIKRAGLEAPGKLTLHSLRHGFASPLIANGLNVVYISQQLGHANPTITLGVYAHQLERADHATAARDALQASYATTVGPGT